MHLLVEILFDVDSKVSVNSSKVVDNHCNHPHVSHHLASHAPDCRQHFQKVSMEFKKFSI